MMDDGVVQAVSFVAMRICTYSDQNGVLIAQSIESLGEFNLVAWLRHRYYIQFNSIANLIRSPVPHDKQTPTINSPDALHWTKTNEILCLFTFDGKLDDDKWQSVLVEHDEYVCNVLNGLNVMWYETWFLVMNSIDRFQQCNADIICMKSTFETKLKRLRQRHLHNRIQNF